MKLHTYLNFGGNCEEAFRFYEKHLGGKVLMSEGGEVFMSMAETFFAHRFGMLRDRFGTSWMILHPRPMGGN